MAQPHPNYRRLSWTLALATTLTAGGVASAESPRWATYANPRFGTLIDYPAELFSERDPPPANSDGQRFHSVDGRARLAVYAFYNIDADTPQSYLDKYPADGPTSYRRVTPRFYALSSRRGDDINYQRCNFDGRTDGTIHCFEITYPAAEQARFDPIVKRLGSSLRAGM